MKEREFVLRLINLHDEFSADLIKAEYQGRGHYTDEDFGFRQFMRWLRQNKLTITDEEVSQRH